MRDRILFIQAIETVRCLEEGVLLSTADANIGSIFGIGFAAWTGGALQFINGMGNVILDTLEIGGVPISVLAAREDFEDSAERLSEILQAFN